MASEIFQIQISLKGFKPKIWRRILIPSDFLLSDFHKVIQTTMGWENAHLHQFKKDKTFYTIKYEDDLFWREMNNVDYKKLKLKISNLLNVPKDKISYEYDFGDGWIHEIVLEKILPFDVNQKYPFCLAGSMNCPPEDCGGIWGYSDLLEILKQPGHEEYESYIDWLGGEFNPEYFNAEEVNKLLRRRNFGCY